MLIIKDLFQCHINKATCNNFSCYFVTNTRLTDEKLHIFRSIACNRHDNSYPINTFYGNTNLMFMNNPNTCDTPINTYTSVHIINYNGTDKCNEKVINSQLYSYRFHCNAIGNVVSINYDQNTKYK